MATKRKASKGLSSGEKASYKKRMGGAQKIIWIILIASFAVFVIMFAFAIINEGPTLFVKTVESINLYDYLAAFLVLFAGYVMRFPKWEMYLNTLKVKVGRLDNFIIYLSMYSMDITPGRAGVVLFLTPSMG